MKNVTRLNIAIDCNHDDIPLNWAHYSKIPGFDDFWNNYTLKTPENQPTLEISSFRNIANGLLRNLEDDNVAYPRTLSEESIAQLKQLHLSCSELLKQNAANVLYPGSRLAAIWVLSNGDSDVQTAFKQLGFNQADCQFLTHWLSPLSRLVTEFLEEYSELSQPSKTESKVLYRIDPNSPALKAAGVSPEELERVLASFEEDRKDAFKVMRQSAWLSERFQSYVRADRQFDRSLALEELFQSHVEKDN